ncbi:MAG TPA: hypothetical protein VLA12_00950 [Planctomycetaceae bacterium]|nr:hypothetical protein [Planctomycetaceae bacterium]
MSVLNLLATSGSRLQADVIKLKNGGEIRGEMNRSRAASGEGPLEIVSLSGIRMLVAREDVLLFSFRSIKTEEYETRAKNSPDTVEAQWELYDWCRKNQFREEAQIHLERMVEIDPNHAEARKLLDHVLHKGDWIPREEMMRQQGYVKYKNRYITLQEMALIDNSAAEAEAEREWTDQIKRWRAGLASPDPQKIATSLASLKEISDPKAVTGLVRSFRNHSQKDARLLMLEILEGIGGEKIVEPLAEQALFDVDVDVRDQALATIPEKYYPQAAHIFAYRLRHKDNTVVRHAGVALKHVGDEQVLGDLINALLTTHTVTVQVPVKKPSVSLGGGAQPVLPPEVEARYLAGQYPHGVIVGGQSDIVWKPVKVQRTAQNMEVLDALQHLTGENFGYDERAWRLWLASYKNRGGSLSKPDPAG